MKIWITSDTHFNHEKIKTMGKGRPDNYEKKIKTALQKIKRKDILIHVGDITMGKDAQIHKFIKSLPYRKILIKGNHDNKTTTWYLANGWDFVCRETVMKLYGKKILFKHVPIGMEAGEGIDIHVHGHLHGHVERINNRPDRMIKEGTHNRLWHYDAGVDNHKFQPINIEQIIKTMEKRKQDL